MVSGSDSRPLRTQKVVAILDPRRREALVASALALAVAAPAAAVSLPDDASPANREVWAGTAIGVLTATVLAAPALQLFMYLVDTCFGGCERATWLASLWRLTKHASNAATAPPIAPPEAPKPEAAAPSVAPSANSAVKMGPTTTGGCIVADDASSSSSSTAATASHAGVSDRENLQHQVYSIDVECVASGYRHCDRTVAQISLVRGDGAVLLDLYVKPAVPVVSYITPLTGLTPELLESRGIPLEEALAELRRKLPRSAMLVGQGIDNDVQWLGLVQGQDFESMVDLASLWCVWNRKFNSMSIFSQEHLAKVLLGEDINGGAHNAVDDAVKAIKLWKLHQQLMQRGGNKAVDEAKASLLSIPVSPPFKKRYPAFEGVCMGDKRACRCGAPFHF